MADTKTVSLGVAYNVSMYRDVLIAVPADADEDGIRKIAEITARKIMITVENTVNTPANSSGWREDFDTVCCQRVTHVDDESDNEILDAFPLQDDVTEIGVDACGFADQLAEGTLTKTEFADCVLASIRTFGHPVPEHVLPLNTPELPMMTRPPTWLCIRNLTPIIVYREI